MALAPLIFFVAGLAAGLPVSEGAIFAVFTVLLLAAAGLVWRFGTWAKIVGLLLALLTAFMGFWIAFGLAFPAAFVDFVPGLLLPVGLLMAVAGSVAGIVAKRRGRTSAEVTAGERRLATTVLTIVVLAAAVSGALSLTSRNVVDGAAAAASATMHNLEFAEDGYEVAAGETIAVHNSDPFVHDFAVPGLGIEPVIILPGSSQLIEIGGDPGTYTIYCTLHSDPSATDASEGDMVATLIVE